VYTRVFRDGIRLRLATAFLLFSAFLFGVPTSPAQTNVTTQHNDIARTGQNINETILTPTNVNSGGFGKLFYYVVDGYIYAQPLYMSGVTMGAGTPQAGTKHNVVFIATEHNSVYAFDADDNLGVNGKPLWQISLLDSAHGAASSATTVPTGDIGSSDIVPEYGITSTPVIDAASSTIYVVGKIKENGGELYRLHALDITTGAEKFGGPAVLSGSVPGNGQGSSGGTLQFNARYEMQRPGLLLLNGIVYIGFGSHGDSGPWHGWILAYNAATLTPTGAWCTTPNGFGAGIWESGTGLTANVPDPVNHPYGYLYSATGTGTVDPTPPYTDAMGYSVSVFKLDLANGVPTILDEFTPFDASALTTSNRDQGSGGPIVLPDSVSGSNHLLMQVGKTGRVYLFDQNNLGGYHPSNTSDPQAKAFVNGEVYGGPAYWNGHLYIWARNDHLKAFSIANGVLSGTPTSTAAQVSGFPGPASSVSANGTSNGIVWSVQTDGYTSQSPEILYAHDAINLNNLLYSSNDNSARDNPGGAVKFATPTIVNGKVYLGAEHQVGIYGLLNGATQASQPVISPAGQLFHPSIQVTITDSSPNAQIFYTTDGSMPSSASTLYAGPITLTNTATLQAVAMGKGYVASTVASETYTLVNQVPTPTFTPAAGNFSSAQQVTISTTWSGSTIYYTTDGSTPTTASTRYSGPVTVSSSTTLKTIATAPNLANSAVATAVYTIVTNAASSLDFRNGFSSGSMALVGKAGFSGTRLRLTDGATTEASAAWYPTQVNVQGFSTDFTFQQAPGTAPPADGITFAIQGVGTTAVGLYGGGLGYGAQSTTGTQGIPKSIAVKFDLFNNGQGNNCTGFYTNGAVPLTCAVKLGGGISLPSWDIFAVHISYDGTTLTLTITDTTDNSKTFTTSWPINIPATVGGNTAYVGFTAGTGHYTLVQDILSWTYVSTATGSGITATPVITPATGTYPSAQSVTITDSSSGATIYYTVDSSQPTSSSIQYTGSFTVGTTTTVKAIATAPNLTQSATASSVITISQSAAATPVITPATGTYSSAQSVTITDSTSGASIYYTLDGSQPTTSSTQYTGSFTVSTTTTVKAIASAANFAQSATASSVITVSQSAAATPLITPATGTYSSAQTVAITDSTSGAIIYYTLDGSQPTTSSKQYTSSFSVSTTTTVKAMATAANFSQSGTATSVITIQSGGGTTINFGSGFVTTGMQFNGRTKLNGTRLELTDGGQSEASSAWFTTPVNVQSFTTDFSFQLTNANADGMTFTIQNAGITALGLSGGGLGYGSSVCGSTTGIATSVAIKFDLFQNCQEGSNSTGLYVDGASPTVPSTGLGGGVNLHSGDTFHVHIVYDGTTLTMTITDTVNTSETFTASWAINIPGTVGSDTAFVGFTAGTGGKTATQEILNWTYGP